jgi:hypothetical protein
MFIAMPSLGTALSGKLLMMSPIGGNGQLRNYALIFTISRYLIDISFLKSSNDSKKSNNTDVKNLY